MIQAYFTFLKNIASTSHLVREFRLLREFIGVSRFCDPYLVEANRVEKTLAEHDIPAATPAGAIQAGAD